jgi:hypothetical protein
MNEESDKAPYAILVCERRPHQWEGTSIADDTMEIQQIKTVLLRNTMDNIYAQNDMQPVYQEGAITDLDALFNPAFGKPISVRPGVSARDALNYNIVPFVAPATFEMLGYLDEELTDRTGISEASSGMAPDALQNMTAKASSMVEAAGIGQTELIVKTLAKGLAQFFKGLLHATIKHQDMPRTVRLRGKWVQVDPRQWNASMDVKINTGLGAGTRERDMVMMTMVTNIQEKMLAGLGPDNPFVKPDNVYNAISKLIEAAGLKTPSLYITEPDPEEVQAKLEAAQNQPDPEAQKAEAQMAIEQAKLEGSMQLKQLEMQANRDKEMAQMQADLEVEKAKLQSETEARRQELEADAVKAQLNAELEREKIAAEIQIKREEMQFQAEVEALKLEAQAKQAAAQEGGTPDISQIVEAIRQTANRSLIRDEFGEIVGSELRESVIN